VVYVEREHCFSAYSSLVDNSRLPPRLSSDRYSYALGDPINFADPTGDCAKPVSCPPGTIPIFDDHEILSRALGVKN
jgi:hypothetical protein